jgi:hypothetical protein
MKHEYLLKEYELCFEQLRFYDERHESILKYIFSLTSAAATAQFAVYQLLHSATEDFFKFQSFLSGIVFFATLLLFLAMLQNRLYFVYIARQINAIRGYLMEVEAEHFRNNQLYTSTNFPALKPFSVHTFQLLGAALMSSLFGGLCAYSIRPSVGCKPSVKIALGASLLVFAAEVGGGIRYLFSSGRKTADEAIHRQAPEKKPGQPRQRIRTWDYSST